MADRAGPVRTVRHRASRAALLLFALALPSLATPARADGLKIAVLAFSGPQGGKAQAEVLRALRRRADIVSSTAWEAAAKKLFARSRSAEDIAAVSSDLGVQVVITGAVKRDGVWLLQVSVRNGPSGKSVEKLRYPLKGPRIDPGVLSRLEEEIGPAVDRAAAGPPSEPGSEPSATAAPKNPDDEAPPGTPGTPEEKKSDASGERPAWAPYFDGSIGLTLGARSFAFDQAGQPQFHSSLAGGLRIDLSGFPLAYFADRPGAGWNAITGLGLGLTLDWVFWPDSIPCNRDPMTNACMTTTERFGTREYRLEAGLRWHWNFLNEAKRPELLVSLQYGRHAFTIDKRLDPMTMMAGDVGPPDVTYAYFDIGLGLRWLFVEYLGAELGLNIHALLDTGAIQSAAEYGPGGGYGIRLHGGLEGRPYKGVVLRLHGFYERFGLSFQQSPMPAPAKSTVGGATDQYYGMILTIGYAF